MCHIQVNVSAAPDVTVTSAVETKATVVAIATKMDSREKRAGPGLSVLPQQPSNGQMDGDEVQSMDVR